MAAKDIVANKIANVSQLLRANQDWANIKGQRKRDAFDMYRTGMSDFGSGLEALYNKKKDEREFGLKEDELGLARQRLFAENPWMDEGTFGKWKTGEEWKSALSIDEEREAQAIITEAEKQRDRNNYPFDVPSSPEADSPMETINSSQEYDAWVEKFRAAANILGDQAAMDRSLAVAGAGKAETRPDLGNIFDTSIVRLTSLNKELLDPTGERFMGFEFGDAERLTRQFEGMIDNLHPDLSEDDRNRLKVMFQEFLSRGKGEEDIPEDIKPGSDLSLLEKIFGTWAVGLAKDIMARKANLNAWEKIFGVGPVRAVKKFVEAAGYVAGEAVSDFEEVGEGIGQGVNDVAGLFTPPGGEKKVEVKTTGGTPVPTNASVSGVLPEEGLLYSQLQQKAQELSSKGIENKFINDYILEIEKPGGIDAATMEKIRKLLADLANANLPNGNANSNQFSVPKEENTLSRGLQNLRNILGGGK